MKASSVFVHSLFRSGSTYLFGVFRRSGAGYWCYQEPLHEAPLHAKDCPESLLHYDAKGSMDLRHPCLDRPYYQELYDVFDAWRDVLAKEAIYDRCFVCDETDAAVSFFRALIDAATGVPVIQECRTSWRIRGLKRALGGAHIFLWRNPWDQWWSYQINDYFDAATMLFINAREHPQAIADFRTEIGFQNFHAEHIENELAHFASQPETPQVRYQAFYILWCLALQEARSYADQIVNIDRLSDDHTYRETIAQHFYLMGMRQLDFSDCRTPQAAYGAPDIAFFREQEDKVHDILLRSGWSRDQLDSLTNLREQYQPRLQQWVPQTEEEVGLARDAERARSVALRLEARDAIRLKAARDHAQRLQKEFDAARAEIDELNLRTHRLSATADELDRELRAVHASTSWRITRPLRQVMLILMSLVALFRRAERRMAGLLGRSPPGSP